MDNGILIAVIAVFGTLAGAVVSTIGMQVHQKSKFKQEVEREKEKEKTLLRREQLSKRLSIIEEAANLIMFVTNVTFDVEVGVGSSCSHDIIVKKQQRVEEMCHEASISSKSISSQELDDTFSKMLSQYWQFQEERIDTNDVDIISTNYKKVIQTINNLKVNA
jgi:mannitol-specific phosphotransferase system IIBC component